jgi:hypothetical protein
MEKHLEFHEVSNIFPMMEKAEFEALKEDIRQNGLNEAIWLYKDKILDGRNRYLACMEMRVKPRFQNYTGSEDSLIDFVLSLNLHRRHLSISQKACLAVDLLPTIEKRNEEIKRLKNRALRIGEVVENFPPPEKSRAKVAKVFGVNERYVSDAKKVKTENEEIFQRVKKGEMNLQQALKALIKKEEKKVVEKIPQPEAIEDEVLTPNDIKKINIYILRDGLEKAIAEKIVRNDRIALIEQKKKAEERKKKAEAKELAKMQKIGFYIEPVVKERLKNKTNNLSEYLRNLIEKDLKKR